jgi:predicted transcriptional regulator
MTETKPDLLHLRAVDLMSRNVVVVPQEMSLRAAARLLSGAQISGAPVVDADGRCVGVLSSTDFMRWTERADMSQGHTEPPEDFCSEWQVVDYEDIPSDRVDCFMTADPVMVNVATSIRELARLMIDAHIHRLIVVDEFCKPVGIVSSTDILAAIVRAAD